MNIVRASTSGVAHAVDILKNGGSVAHATETCYGLACDLTNPEAVAKLFTLKERPMDQPVSALFSSIEEAKRYVVWNTRAEELARKYLPGPLTLILSIKNDTVLYTAPTQWSVGSFQWSVRFPTAHCPLTTIGIRLSSHPTAQALAHAFGAPLSTTSANLHGKPEAFSVQEIAEQFSDRERKPDLIIDSGTLPKSLPSTIVDLSGEEEKIIRQGGIVVS